MTRPLHPGPRRPEASPADQLYVFVLEGDDPKGVRRCLLAFARGSAEGRAGKRADDRLLALGWSDLELQGARLLDRDLQAAADPFAFEAMAKAYAEGFAMLVY